MRSGKLAGLVLLASAQLFVAVVGCGQNPGLDAPKDSPTDASVDGPGDTGSDVVSDSKDGSAGSAGTGGSAGSAGTGGSAGSAGTGGSCGDCNSPPANECADATTIKKFDPTGECLSGKCSYAQTSSPCPFGCAGGVCNNCTGSCTGKQCGDDGCGVKCADCQANAACTATQTCACSYKTCETACCAAGQVCSTTDKKCCTPSCTGKQCGDDGCGGSCGTCGTGYTCGADGTCTCPSAIVCGSACCASSGQVCSENACTACGNAKQPCCAGSVCSAGIKCVSSGCRIAVDTSIYNVQSGAIAAGTLVHLNGPQVTALAIGKVYVQETAGSNTAYRGIAVSYIAPVPTMKIGDSVYIEGVVSEIGSNTTITDATITVIGSGLPVSVTDTRDLATVANESMEGVFVSITGEATADQSNVWTVTGCASGTMILDPSIDDHFDYLDNTQGYRSVSGIVVQVGATYQLAPRSSKDWGTENADICM